MTFWKLLGSFVLYTLAALGLMVVVAGILGFLVYDHVMQPGIPGETKVVDVPQGATGRDIAQLLEDEGLVEHEGFFRLALRLSDSDRDIRHGKYTLARGLSARELLERLRDGPASAPSEDQVAVTIPEGLSNVQIAELIDDPVGFLEAARNTDKLSLFNVNAETLEGFLMPNTYFFDDSPTGPELVDRMVSQFELEYARLLDEIPGAGEFDPMQVLTVASIVEEEARVDDERPLVASVIYNRLRREMTLQMDSTLQYALGKYNQRMLDADKEVESPYNTYKYPGLPPGPISNPGVASIRAALAPADSDYLFFVSNADGKTHTFSKTAAEHARAVAKYRREIAIQRREAAQ